MSRTLDEILFAEESQDAPILIAGPAESAGLLADAIWFLGADEDAWPAGGSAHPLLPIDVQREADMPHASPQLDWGLAESITRRLLASSSMVRISYARQSEGVEKRPSRLVTQIAGATRSLPEELAAASVRQPLAIAFEDTARIPMKIAVPVVKSTGQLNLFDSAVRTTEVIPLEVPGGSNVLTSQSQCAFKAFATARLGAQGWEAAQAGPYGGAARAASARSAARSVGRHAAWHSHVRRNCRTWARTCVSFVEDHVRRVLEEEMPAGAREQMPAAIPGTRGAAPDPTGHGVARI